MTEPATVETPTVGEVTRSVLPDTDPTWSTETETETEPAAAAGGLDLAAIRKYKTLRERQAEADAEATALKEEADELEQQLVEMFSEAGVPSIQLDGKTIYLHGATFAQWEAGLEADVKRQLLRGAGFGELVTETINGNTLNAWVREMVGDEDNPGPGLPPSLLEYLSLGERYSIRINAAGARRKSKTHSK